MFSIPFNVEKSITINRGSAEVFKSVSDFSEWGEWSPWICQEPSCPVTIEGASGTEGHCQAWDGDLIGSGRMHITKAEPNKSLEYDLLFIKPWKSRSKTGFRFSAEGNSTRVTWWMTGSVPIFMFFMKKMMSVLVGGDYDRGLSMLKEYLETGTVLSETTVKGVVEREGLYYLGRRRSCGLSEVGPKMEEDFVELGRLLEGSSVPEPKEVFSIYHSYEMVKGRCEYTSGFLYDSPQKASEGLVAGQIPAHRAVKVNHRGPYRHLGNAWMTAMGYVRAKHKANKALPMYETYPNNPNEVEEKDVQVEIYLPVKG